MSDTTPTQPSAAPASTAGALLRKARQAQGLHIAALAAAIKVAPRKLELLETDRYDELPDATFTRALAQTVCRSLKIDAAPVLALLPHLKGYRLEHVSEGLNEPFRERPDHLTPKDWGNFARPAVWAPLLIVAAAAAVYLLPSGWLKWPQSVPQASSTVTPPTPDTPGAPQATTSTVTQVVPAAGAEVPAVAVSGALQLRASAESWVEVLDANGQSLFARLVQPGETVGVDGEPPLKVRIGNAAVTQVVFRGQPMELAPFTRENVARLELK